MSTTSTTITHPDGTTVVVETTEAAPTAAAALATAVRHVVLLKLQEDTPQAAVDELLGALALLPAKIPQIRSYKFGPQLAAVDDGRNVSVGIVADFESEADYLVYAKHEAHIEAIVTFIKPILAPGGRTAMQYKCESTAGGGATPKFKVCVSEDREMNGLMAASYGANILRKVLKEKGSANVIVATGASQFEMLEHLVKCEGIDWTKVSLMHLDEYVGMDDTHGASFAKYLQERFVDQLPADNKPKSFDFVCGLGDPQAECERLGKLAVEKGEWDVSFIGIGENGHLAFNDPPCDSKTTAPYIVVDLDEGCRLQQQGEGWFPTLADVPKQAISMGMAQILSAKNIVVTVPDARKALALFNSATLPVTDDVPGTHLQTHPSCVVFTDRAGASML